MSEAQIITLADGIDIVATRYAEQFEPEQRRVEAGWHDLQRLVGALGVPIPQRNKMLYRLPPVELPVTAVDFEDRLVDTTARITVRGVLKHVRQARRAMSILQRCHNNDATLLPGAQADLWSTIHEETDAYLVTARPVTPGVYGEEHRLRRPKPPTRIGWMEIIDKDGPSAAWHYYTEDAQEQLDTICDTMALFEHDRGSGPSGDGLRLVSGWFGTEAGVQL